MRTIFLPFVFGSLASAFVPDPSALNLMSGAHAIHQESLLCMLAPKQDDNEASASNPSADDNNDDDDGDTLKYTRFSKYAPDTSLSSEDFRAQLKENMKADLERRRREDPNRGNQPAKSYLDSL
jgi:hypothetical protein